LDPSQELVKFKTGGWALGIAHQIPHKKMQMLQIAGGEGGNKTGSY
jgi:hypothetical protein